MSSESALRNWHVKVRGAVDHGNGELSESEPAELIGLREENLELRIQRDVLERAVALWVDEGMGR